MRTSSRPAALVLSAAVLLPVLPAVVGASAASAAAPAGAAAPAVTPAAKALTTAWLTRDARAKAIVAHLAKRRAAAAARAAAVAGPADRDALRAAAAWAARDSRAKATVAMLARRKLAAALPVRASRSSARSTATTTWDRLAQCEAGGNWKINTGNGYYGGLQFSAASWRGVGGAGLPHQATRAEQIRRGELLQAKQGWGAWPSCSRKLGLR